MKIPRLRPEIPEIIHPPRWVMKKSSKRPNPRRGKKPAQREKTLAEGAEGEEGGIAQLVER